MPVQMGATPILCSAGDRFPAVAGLQAYRTILYESMQHTQLSVDAVLKWLEGRIPESTKASLPPLCAQTGCGLTPLRARPPHREIAC